MTAFADLPGLGEEATIYTHLSIREDAHILFGFASYQERDLFRMLIKIGGIGPKMGVVILSGMSAQNLAEAIAREDSLTLTKLPGIGKKTAERLVVELKDKFKSADISSVDDNTIPGNAQNKTDAIDALVTLGYKVSESDKMVSRIYRHEYDSETLIRLALKAKVGS